MVPEPLGTDNLSLTFSALADPTRRAILARLVSSAASVAELAKPFDISVRAVSKHLRVLERAGLIGRTRDAQRRPSRIQAAPLHEVHAWIEGYRRLWEDRFDRINGVLNDVRKDAQ